MALQRYREKNIAATTGGGIAERAEAGLANTLMQRLSSFSNIALKEMKETAISEAEDDFADKVLSGEDLDTIDDNTVYAKKYNNLSRNKFFANMTADAKNKAVELSVKFATNPVGFQKAMETYKSTLMNGVKDKQMIAHGSGAFDQVAESALSRIRASYLKGQTKLNAEGNSYLSLQLEDNINRSFIESQKKPLDEALGKKFKASVAEYGSFLKGQIKSGIISETTAKVKLDQARKTAYKSFIKDGIRFAEKNNKQEVFLEKLKDMSHEGTGLTLAEVKDLEDEVYESIAKRNNAISNVKKREKIVRDEITLHQNENFDTIMNEVVTQGKDMGYVKARYEEGDITYDHYKEIRDEYKNGYDKDVVTEEIITDIMAYPTTYSKSAIMKSALSNETKQKAIKLIDSAPKFTSGLNYKAGLDSIYGKFKVDMNGIVQISSDADIENLNTVKRAYHDIISSLPDNGTRERDAKMISDRLLEAFMKNDKVKKESAKQIQWEIAEKQVSKEFATDHPTSYKFFSEFKKVR